VTAAEPEPQLEPETVTAAEPVTPNVPGPSAQVDASVQASSAARTPSPSASAESSEGELWALVGATGPADGSAPRSSVMRVALTVLMALVILVIVVASLVLASQVA
jgi:hypothetical protein